MERLDDFLDEKLWDLVELLQELKRTTRGSNRARVVSARKVVFDIREELENWGWLPADEVAA